MKGTATATGLGSGTLLLWLWTSFMVPGGYPEMPIEVAGVLAASTMKLADALGDWITKKWSV